MRTVIIAESSPEWAAMWKWLEDHPINEPYRDTQVLHLGEGWQYMGTTTNDKDYIHTFRHRCHPMTNARKDLTLMALNKITQKDLVVTK